MNIKQILINIFAPDSPRQAQTHTCIQRKTTKNSPVLEYFMPLKKKHKIIKMTERISKRTQRAPIIVLSLLTRGKKSTEIYKKKNAKCQKNLVLICFDVAYKLTKTPKSNFRMTFLDLFYWDSDMKKQNIQL